VRLYWSDVLGCIASASLEGRFEFVHCRGRLPEGHLGRITGKEKPHPS
jgi:hypothetical protein